MLRIVHTKGIIKDIIEKEMWRQNMGLPQQNIREKGEKKCLIISEASARCRWQNI